ncbi:unnamed protein product [Menidia menidia]|uniref:(Atlantic silverside) hypothetical protein n=1 Tax=Menidia menidia TaxID=238744 RepID=A0A8S4ARD8_9TELE|nr:unnamed protein product [Menidia menidia]
MYSSGYSQVNKLSPQGQKKMQYRSKGKSCGYYMRIVFFFSSLIQSLIIISLVLFLVYGKNEDSASTTNIQDLEETFSRLSIENVALRHQRKNLTNILNATLTEKARNDWDLAHLRHLSNVSFFIIHDYDRRLQQCNTEALGLKLRCSTPFRPQAPLQPFSSDCSGVAVNQLKAAYALLESNFTQTVQSMKMETEQIVKERDSLNLEAIHLRRDKSILEKEIQNYRQMTKDRFHDSMKSVSNVSRAFLKKIDSLLPRHLAFQLTCPKQRDHLEQIRSNCTSLSREVEEKLQYYMNNVGEEVSIIQAENNHLKAENWRLSEDYRWCSQNRTGMIEQHRQNREELQRNHDQAKEKLLIDKLKLIGEKKVLESSVKYKNTEVDHLREQIRQLNMTCLPKTTSASFGYRPNTQTGSFGGTGSSFGGGRTAQGGAQSLVSQHLQDLQRLINPSDPQEKQDLSRMLG